MAEFTKLEKGLLQMAAGRQLSDFAEVRAGIARELERARSRSAQFSKVIDTLETFGAEYSDFIALGKINTQGRKRTEGKSLTELLAEVPVQLDDEEEDEEVTS